MVVWGFEIGELLAAALRYRHLRFQQFCIKIIIKGIQKSEITDCETGGCGMSVTDNGGVYFVPAFSGLFAPYWRSDARGVIVGLTRAATKAHLARAALEAICYQTRDVMDAMVADSGVPMKEMRVDGGITANSFCMQMQADVMGIDITRPLIGETTALGAAYAAGLAVGFWSSTDELRKQWQQSRRWNSTSTAQQRANGYAGWHKAVERTLNWVD